MARTTLEAARRSVHQQGRQAVAPLLWRWGPWALAALALAAYLAIGMHELTRFPAWHQDEPWIASVAYSLATRGIYGSPIFAGYAGMEQHYFDFMPMYAWMLAGLFKLIGVGEIQVRLMPLLCGLGALIATFVVGRQVGGDRVGALAVVLLVGQRIMAVFPQTGVPLLDIARVARYDIAVPIFGLLACAAFNRAERLGRGRWYLISGVLVGLAGLTHLYGNFWLPALLLALLWRRGPAVALQRPAYLLIGGFALAWAPWVAYILANLADFMGQMWIVRQRFHVLTLDFYLNNLLRERERYQAMGLVFHTGAPDLPRPGAWLALLGLPPALAVALWPTRRAISPAGFSVALALVVHLLLFAVLFEPKTYSYTIAIWPLLAIMLAGLGIWLWDRYAGRLVRGALLTLLVCVLAEGGLRISVSHTAAAELSSFEGYMGRVRQHIPADARVMGLHNYWLELRDHPYQTWVVPVLLATPGPYNEHPIPLDQAIARFQPDVFLIDWRIADHLAQLSDPSNPNHAQFEQFWRYMQQHSAYLAATIDDPTYGRMQIYTLTRDP
jgi:4-amino-4-deoxy-L-arabinose transferase-like glycosyltransferase